MVRYAVTAYVMHLVATAELELQITHHSSRCQSQGLTLRAPVLRCDCLNELRIHVLGS